MAISFNHKPSGSIVGTGAYAFRHYGSESSLLYSTVSTTNNTIATSANSTSILKQNVSYSTDNSVGTTDTQNELV